MTETAEPQLQTLAIPMGNERPVIVEGPFPITARQWVYMIDVLSAMKPGLVVPELGLVADADNPALGGGVG